MTDRLFCMNCGRSSIGEAVEESSILKTLSSAAFVILNIALLGLPIFRRNKAKKKQKMKCDYCGSDFIFPDTPENRELFKSYTTKRS